MRIDEKLYPNLARLFKAQIEAAPDHSSFLTQRFSGLRPAQFEWAESLATLILAIVGDELVGYCEDYVYICNLQLKEEVFFRRFDRYRCASFAEAIRDVYDRPEVMRPYMNGLLMTQLWWANHTAALNFFQSQFLAQNPANYTHLEIGPGHGLLLYLACADPNCQAATGWDISDSSISKTRSCLEKLGVDQSASLELRDLFALKSESQFESIAFSEVLEHMEQPREALQMIHNHLKRDGRLFLNVPLNSPAPDHIFLLRSSDEVHQILRDIGFGIESLHCIPATNQSFANAIQRKQTITCLAIARRLT